MMGAVNFSGMDTPIIIESASVTNHAETNEPVKVWATHATLWGKQLGPQSKEAIEASQPVAVATVRYMIRRLATITETMRINKNSVYYYISGIEDFGRQGYMIITAEKRDNE